MRKNTIRVGFLFYVNQCGFSKENSEVKGGGFLEPIRILQVVTIMNRGGLETMLMNYYRKLDRSIIQFDFMVHRTDRGHYDDEIESMGGNIYRMPQIKPGNYRQYFKILDVFFAAHQEYRVVHSHINENSSFVLRAAKKAGVSGRIAHSHLSDLGFDLKLPFRLFARYNMKDNPSHYFACSKKAGRWLFGQQIDNIGEIKLLNNAVNAEEFRFNKVTRNRVRKELGIEDKLVIGHIGRFNKQKNHEFLIDIFKSVHEKKPESVLLLVGEGHLRSTIEKKVAENGLTENVRFLGIRGDVADLIQGMDLFLFPSLFEGLPVVLVEAQAAGVHCLVSDTITKETDVTGLLDFISLKGDANEWAEKVLDSSTEHIDTLETIKKNKYDSASMAKWLTDFYSKYYLAEVH